MHPNDTLRGRLIAFEREDEKHLRQKFGYWRMVEERMIREELLASGVEPTVFNISKRVEENHASDVPFREQSSRLRANTPIVQSNAFTQEELAFLVEHFTGANDPIAQSVLAKALAQTKK